MDERTLAQRLEAIDTWNNVSYVQARATLEPGAGHATRMIGDGAAVYTGRESPINRVHGLGMAAPVTPAMIDQAEHFFNAHDIRAAIDLCPLADPSLAAELQRRGYAVALFKHVLFRALASLDDIPTPGAAVRVRPIVRGEETLWAQVVANAFAGRADLDDRSISLPLPHAHKAGTVCFLAWLDDVPAGGGAVTMHDGVAICYSTSVRPPMRRLGVQTALLAARLHHARAAGCELAVVQTSPGSASYRNVARFGFRIAYTKPTVLQPDINRPPAGT